MLWSNDDDACGFAFSPWPTNDTELPIPYICAFCDFTNDIQLISFWYHFVYEFKLMHTPGGVKTGEMIFLFLTFISLQFFQDLKCYLNLIYNHKTQYDGATNDSISPSFALVALDHQIRGSELSHNSWPSWLRFSSMFFFLVILPQQNGFVTFFGHWATKNTRENITYTYFFNIIVFLPVLP